MDRGSTPESAPLTTPPLTRARTPVMADVARLAGVSHQTVSRVINDHRSVSAPTRSRVERAILELGYRRNTAARALVTRRSGTIGVISVDTSQFGPANTLFGIEQAARARGYFVTLAGLRLVDRSTMRAAVDHLAGAGVDGIIVVAPLAGATETVAAVAPGLPLVRVSPPSGGNASDVAIDQEQGARLATRHLLDLGHRTVHHVRGPDAWLEAGGRELGWRSELEAAGTAPPPVLSGDWTPASGLEAGRRLAMDPSVRAVFVANDQMALGVLLALREAGRDVPGDVSVVGFDDIPEAGYFAPPLTTVRQDFEEVGRRAIEALLALVADREPTGPSSVEPELIVRASTGSP